MKAWELVMAQRFKEALDLFTLELSVKEDALTLANRATAALCLGDLGKAERDFRRATEIYANTGPAGSNGWKDDLAVIFWLKGEERPACQAWNETVDGVASGKVQFTDVAGGVKPGCFLWFGGVASRQSEHADKALKHIAKRVKRGDRLKSEVWPRPIGRYIIGQIGIEQLLEAAQREGHDPGVLPPCPDPDFLVKRALCESTFWIAVSSLARGDKEKYEEWLDRCVSPGNPILEMEYYIAAYELKRCREGKGRI